MSDESGACDQSRQSDRPSRRSVLSATGAAVLGALAGCSGDRSGETPTAESTPTGSPAPAPTDTASPTATSTDTPTPTATDRDIEALLAEYRCPGGEEFDAVVAEDGSGDFESVQAAIDAIPAATFDGYRVLIKPGRYEEKIRLPPNRTDVTFVGESAAETVLTYDDHADKSDGSGGDLGTSQSSSFFADGLDFTARNLTFENAANPVAQAVAMRISGDRAFFDNCRFLGNQDTLYNYGRGTRQYFRNCYVEGDVDFIFGLATAVFDDCEIHCTDEGYIAAPATPEDQAYGYVFRNCEITGDAPEESVYLGRPWEPYGQAVFVNCHLGDVIRPAGWEPWDEPEHDDKTETAFLAEYDNEGPGAAPDRRVDWAHQLSDEEAQPYQSLETLFDGWEIADCLDGEA
ncbi:Pectinesterase [Halosimplex carlsbadense 2-9-1]|uniref:Pectinesterase n=1 Tax=Halosimplex carlsbadense 2-9-1 TaxID=797114 RepID=M0CBL3_9EURY|nr:pectinesterase family protein [Halosimplex carlsbadense]ELZ19993.1 Pectinesterase [Halosimplex carlsbadense 2-9-1]